MYFILILLFVFRFLFFFSGFTVFFFFNQKRFLKTQGNYNVESRRFDVIMTPFSRQSEEVTDSEVMRRNQIFALLTDEVSKKKKEKKKNKLKKEVKN